MTQKIKSKIYRLKEVDQKKITIIAKNEKELFGVGGLDEWHLPVILRYGRLYLFELNDDIIGAAQLIRSWDEPGTVYLYGISIIELHQDRGFGRLFLKSVINELKKEQWRNLLLTVDPANIVAISLYRSFGFETIKELQNEYGTGINRLLMKLNLVEA